MERFRYDCSSKWLIDHHGNLILFLLLATGEPGLMPWVPLTRLDGPAPAILGECRRIIDEKAKPEEHANLLAVTQVLMNLVHHEAALHAIVGGKEAMIDSPILNELIAEKVAEAMQKAVLGLLEDRFGAVPLDVAQRVKDVTNADHLLQINKRAARCPDLDTFRQALGT
jgi:hypothetical protein